MANTANCLGGLQAPLALAVKGSPSISRSVQSCASDTDRDEGDNRVGRPSQVLRDRCSLDDGDAVVLRGFWN
jgi:hypothetical protein